jgi:hypothetical protein
MLLLSSKITARKRRSSLIGTSWAAWTTMLLNSSNTACNKRAQAGVNRLSTALSLTDTSRISAVEANCSRLACGCC